MSPARVTLLLIFNVVVIRCQDTSALPGSSPQTTAIPSSSAIVPTAEVWQRGTRPWPDTVTVDNGFTDTNTTQDITSTTAPPAESENTTSSIVGSPDIDSSKSGQADDLADYILQKIGQMFQGEEKPKEEVKDSPSSLSNCSVPVGLSQFSSSSVPDSVYTYFDNDVTFQGLCKKLFVPSVVEQLQNNCPQGGWCLDDQVRQTLTKTKDSFYMEGPFCSNALWNCLNSMFKVRFDCEGKLILFMMNAIKLLCDMENAGDVLTNQCYGHTLEALYVTYADLTHPNGTHKDQLNLQDCNDFRVQMTSSYLCANDSCEFEQQRDILKKFEPWLGLSEGAVGVVQSCNISNKCQPGNTIVLGPLTTPLMGSYDDYLSELKELEDEIEDAIKVADGDELIENETSTPTVTLDNPDGYEKPSESEQSPFDKDINAGSTGLFDEDRPMLFGLITMTVVLMIGLVGVAYIGFRRYRRTLFANYRRGYSQLTEEESKMLRQEYN